MSFEELKKQLKKAIISEPEEKPKVPKKPKKKKRTIHTQPSITPAPTPSPIPTFDIQQFKEEIKRIIKESMQEIIQEAINEGIRRAKEVNERNIIQAVWNGEYGGVKLSTLVLVFGRDKSVEIQRILYSLLERGILVKDRNGWWHINPQFLEVILEYYNIPYDPDEIQIIKRRLRKRFTEWRFPTPSL